LGKNAARRIVQGTRSRTLGDHGLKTSSAQQLRDGARGHLGPQAPIKRCTL